MNNIIKLGALLVMLPMTAQAVTYNTDFVRATTTLKAANGVITDSFDVTATAANTGITVTTVTPFGGKDYTNGTAYQNSNAISLQTFDGEYSTGTSGYNRYDGVTDAQYEVTNDEPGSGEIVYDFGLSKMEMTILNGFGPNVNPFLSAQDGSVGGQFVFEAFMGGGTEPGDLVYKATYEFWTYSRPGGVGAGIGIGLIQNLSAASITPLHFSSPTFTDGYTVTLNDLSGEISLGQFDEGESKIFNTRTSLVVIASSYEHNVTATYGDPGDFGTFERAMTPMSPVPLPAAGFMLLAGLLGLGVIRKTCPSQGHSA